GPHPLSLMRARAASPPTRHRTKLAPPPPPRPPGFPPFKQTRHFPPPGPSAEPQLLHDFGIRRDGFFRFTGKRHPYAGDMHHNGDRTDRQLTAGLSQTVSPPVGPDDRLRDGTSRRLKLKWNAVRVAQHLHRLVFAQVNIFHRGEKLIDFLLL